MNKNVVLGIVAGVAAVAVAGFIAKRTGILDSLLNKLGCLADEVEDKITNFEKVGMQDLIPKGEDKNVTKSALSSHN
jgi:hypothetical protein